MHNRVEQNMKQIYETLCGICGAAHVLVREPMSRHTTFRTGGPADLLVRGVVLEIGKQMSDVVIEGTVITAGAGAMLSSIASRAAAAELTGMEFASGIPGSLGGAVVMNAGAYGGEMKDILQKVTVLTPDGTVQTLSVEELELSYRHSIIPEKGYLVISAVLKLQPGNADEIQSIMDDLKEKRVSKQPLEYPSAGSTFKRPEGYFAGKLIQDAGLRGFRVIWCPAGAGSKENWRVLAGVGDGMEYVIVTGMSGAGKSTALKIMEDIGYFCVDNFPIPLLEKFVEFADSGETQYQKIAFGLDIRSGESLKYLDQIITNLRMNGHMIRILFMDASDQVLVKRYKETRRAHPLAGTDRVEKGIEQERRQISFLKEMADYIIDTSQLLTRELHAALGNIFLGKQEYDNIYVTVLSFGFKYGIPSDADLVFDVRFLPNPYYLEALRPKTGNDPEIQQFVLKAPEANIFLDKLEDMIRFLIPNYIREGKNQLVIAIGCTGGKHRSVTLTNAIYQRLKKNQKYGLRVEHRDIDKDAKRGK